MSDFVKVFLNARSLKAATKELSIEQLEDSYNKLKVILDERFAQQAEEVKMLMIDPKMVELNPYKSVPHLMHPVITDMKKAEAVLAWAVDKMEERYDLLARAGVRHS